MDIRMENSSDTKVTIHNINQRIFDRLFPVTVVIGTEAVVGLVGNILILCVYSRFYKHCNFRYFVLFMAFYDLTNCLIALPGEMYLQSNWFNFKHDYICKIKSYFNVVTAWGSAFTLFLLACDRYRKVCRPLSSQMQPSTALKLCLFGVMLSYCVAIPDALLWGIQSYKYEKDNYVLNLSICEKSDDYKDKIYPFVYIVCIYIVPLGIMTVVICTVNTLIARKMFIRTSLVPLKRRKASYQTKIYSRKTIFTVSGPANKQSCHSSYDLSTTSECNIDLKEPQGNGSENGIDVRESDISLSVTCVSMEGAPNETNSRDPTSNAYLKKQNSPQASNDAFLRRENSYTVHTSSVIRRVQKTSCTRRNRRALSETMSDTEIRRKRKTLIMLILTSVFVLTISIYVALISVVAETRGKLDIMRQLENSNIVVFLFFLRFYFINSIINPILYGLLDPRFRTGLRRLLFCCLK